MAGKSTITLSSFHKRRLLKDFLLLSLPVLALGFIIVFVFYRNYTRSIDYIIEQNELQNVELQSHSLHAQFHPLLEDIIYVSRVENLLALKDSEYGLEEIIRLRGIYSSFMGRKRGYDQIRFIDVKGKEFLRINNIRGGPDVVPPDELQDKADRPYFQEALKLAKGMVYVSPLELNMENGEIELPYNPVIRFATPIYSGGKLLGIVVLNYRATNIFEEVKIGAEFSYGKYYLVNPDSFWAYNPDNNDEWEFSVTMSEEELSSKFPFLPLERIRNGEGGSFYSERGLITFSTIRPLIHREYVPDSLNNVYVQEGYEWKLVSCVPREVFRDRYAPGRRRTIIIAMVLGIFSLIVLFFLSLNRQRRLAAEEDLTEEAAIFSGNPAPVIKVSSDGIVERSNPASTRLFAGEAEGKNIESLLPNYGFAHWKFASGEQVVQFEESINEKTYLFTLNADSVKENGSVVIYGTDISSRKRIELEYSKLSKAVDQSANTIVITDTEGNITFANKAFEKSTGYTIAEAYGRNPRILKSGYQPESVYKDLWETLRKGGAWHGEFLNKRKDGSTYWEDAVITPIKNNDNEVVSYLAVKEDITGRKIAEENLRQAKEEAEIANKLKSEFLANMSHEIRTPMNAIIGFTELLLDTENDSEKQDKLELIKKSGRNLLNLINDILDFSKIEAGKIKIENNVFNLERTLNHIKTMYDIVAEEKGLTFALEKEDSVPAMVYGDELRLNQILLNVVSNAFKFTEKGFVKIVCVYTNKELTISVSDSGVGIGEDKFKSIFSAFEQADSSTERRFGGTGLGLAISRRLARLMKGDITVESELGKGTTFTIRARLMPADGVTAGEKGSAAYRSRENLQREIGEQMVRNWQRQMRGDPEMEKILFDGIFELPRKLEKLEDAVARNRRADIKFIVHDLKGFSGNLNMAEIYEKASAIDEEINKEDYSQEYIREIMENLRLLVDSIPSDYLMNKRKNNLDIKKINPHYSILLAEDNEINQRLIRTFLKGINLECDVAPNGQIALEELEGRHYDLLLLDMQMPVVDGEELIKRIRNHKRLNNLYVIALTAHAMKGDAERYINLGCNDYLSKPVDRRLLYEKIQKHVLNVYNREEGKSTRSEKEEAERLKSAVTPYAEKLRDLLYEFEDVIKIFNPDKIVNLADDLKEISAVQELNDIADSLKEAAGSFDDQAVRNIVERLSNIVEAAEKED